MDSPMPTPPAGSIAQNGEWHFLSVSTGSRGEGLTYILAGWSSTPHPQ